MANDDKARTPDAVPVTAMKTAIRVEGALWLRLYDALASAVFGAVAAIAASWLVPEGWVMPIAMVVGMGVGMIAALPTLALFSIVLGGFELIVLSMNAGMLSGMISVMLPLDIVDAAYVGAGVGVLVWAALLATHRFVYGEVTQ